MTQILTILILSLLLPIYSYTQIESRIENDTIFQTELSFMILFETNKDSTDSIPVNKIIRLRNALELHQDGFVQMEARTDSHGSQAYNMKLAERRLHFAKDILVGNKVQEDRIMGFTFGKIKPLADNDSEEGRQKNRSVSIAFQRAIPLSPISGRVVCRENGQGLQGKVFINTGYTQYSVKSTSDGDFTIPVPESGKFYFDFFSPNHIKERGYYQLSSDKEKLIKIFVSPFKPDELFDFDDILFYTSTTTVMRNYRHNLFRLYEMLRITDGYNYEIQGHVNCHDLPPQPEGTYCYNLSKRRAKKVYTYLVEEGIDPERLKYKPYSNFDLYYSNPRSESQHRKNRRVTVKVLGSADQ